MDNLIEHIKNILPDNGNCYFALYLDGSWAIWNDGGYDDTRYVTGSDDVNDIFTIKRGDLDNGNNC